MIISEQDDWNWDYGILNSISNGEICCMVMRWGGVEGEINAEKEVKNWEYRILEESSMGIGNNEVTKSTTATMIERVTESQELKFFDLRETKAGNSRNEKTRCKIVRKI